MYTIAKILEMLAVQNTRMGEVVKAAAAKVEVHHRKLPCPWDKKGQVIRMAYESAKNKNPELVEGVKINLKDSWILMVPDPDAAYFHLWVEANDERRAKELLQEYSEKITKWMA
jgi:mannose-1-phosphate guanylyltransferase/phosphomannomutase